jgi:uncharacterized repeat protein (TIGR01451 family)
MKSLHLGVAIFTVALTLGLSNQANARGADAGSTISNTASVDYTVGTVSTTTSSNTVNVTVAEILAVEVTAPASALQVSPGQTQRALRFRVENIGNGPEAFALSLNSNLGGDDFNPTAASPEIYLDNGDGLVGAGDTPYQPGVNDPLLNEDDFVWVIVVHNIPTTATDGENAYVTLTANARTNTGAGTPGLVYPGDGEGGTDAVVGQRAPGVGSASETEQGEYIVEAVTITANKSQTVTDPFGANRPLPGATIRYSVAVNAVGSGTATTVVFTDNIPAGTDYVAGSLRLNGAPLTDAAADDAGVYEAAPTPRVRVTIGNLAQADGTRTIEFDVTIRTAN